MSPEYEYCRNEIIAHIRNSSTLYGFQYHPVFLLLRVFVEHVEIHNAIEFGRMSLWP